MSLLNDLALIDKDDTWKWSIEEGDDFSVKGTRSLIDEALLPLLHTPSRWLKTIPIKANLFIWRLLLDRLSLRVNLALRGIPVNSLICPTCSMGVEVRHHMFLLCNTVSNLWRKIIVWIGRLLQHGGFGDTGMITFLSLLLLAS
ncbi:uncharacterized protein [Rutidosis leptorrhynchoides]|uniref:uncharacterized protein n=1 Tax=Rutidosis leptorrhynchoides TaxID=125765 RepID=UPI003A9A32F0